MLFAVFGSAVFEVTDAVLVIVVLPLTITVTRIWAASCPLFKRSPRYHVTYQKAARDFQHQLEKVVPDSWAEAWLRTCLGRAHAGLGDAASAIAEG
jgi:hypothetical protein